MSEKTRYTDEELEEFKTLILQKLDKARKEYESLRADVMNSDGNDTTDTSPTFKVLEEGASTLSKEEAGRLAQRQAQFIRHLQAALVRIENKTYGIDRITGNRSTYSYPSPTDGEHRMGYGLRRTHDGQVEPYFISKHADGWTVTLLE